MTSNDAIWLKKAERERDIAKAKVANLEAKLKGAEKDLDTAIIGWRETLESLRQMQIACTVKHKALAKCYQQLLDQQAMSDASNNAEYEAALAIQVSEPKPKVDKVKPNERLS